MKNQEKEAMLRTIKVPFKPVEPSESFGGVDSSMVARGQNTT
jgi:hypothetical protein